MLNSLATTVVTPAKCVGRARPSIECAQLVDRDGRERRLGVHLFDGRREHVMHTKRLAQTQIAFQVAGIVGQILVRTELQRVDEDRHRHDVAARRCLAHQRQVPVVEVAHRRDHADPSTRPAFAIEGVAERRDRFVHIHVGSLADPSTRRQVVASGGQSTSRRANRTSVS